jgi:hypothetical protein
MMEGVGLEKGLVRFVSENGIKNRTPFQWTRRVKSYTALLAGLVIVLVTLLVTRRSFETTILRQRGSTYQIAGDGNVSNIFEIDLANKTRENYIVTLELEGAVGKIETVVPTLKLKAQSELKERFVIEIPFEELEKGKKILYVRVKGDGKEIERVKVKFIGPIL